VVQGVAKRQFHLRQALEVMADDVFVRHTDAAMQLHCLLPHKPHGDAQLILGTGHRSTPLFGGCIELE